MSHEIGVARPFTYHRHHHQRPHWRFGVGRYMVDDETYAKIVGTPALLHQLDVEVLRRGETLMQHRPPAWGYYGGSVYYQTLSVVTAILAQEVEIWRWPPGPNSSWFPFSDAIAEAPGELITVMTPITTEDGKHGWQPTKRVLERTIPHHRHYSGHGTPVAVEQHPFASKFNPAALNDTVVFGEALPTVPLRLGSHPPLIPAETERARELRLRQADAVARAQRDTDWGEIVRSQGVPAPAFVESERFRALRDAGRPPPARVWVVEGFVSADDDQ
jgi:hypothetical protein